MQNADLSTLAIRVKTATEIYRWLVKLIKTIATQREYRKSSHGHVRLRQPPSRHTSPWLDGYQECQRCRAEQGIATQGKWWRDIADGPQSADNMNTSRILQLPSSQQACLCLLKINFTRSRESGQCGHFNEGLRALHAVGDSCGVGTGYIEWVGV